ncbi:hypothetical protein [Alkalihalobacillus sp. R86527]|uniref:hypothetical protein n=1 Tax=Alkalihalobacillus sp. R86527 TaxID=3093863 RepID=UPI00366CA131
MEFPIIHTNFWDAVLAIPVIMIVTEIIKLIFKVPKAFVPTVALCLGVLISVFYAHPKDLYAGLFMGFFYGYGAVGNYSALKYNVIALRSTKKQTYTD